jgi:hypothetical protein
VSRESLRDQSVERLLKESFRTSARTPQPGSCLDAETLAAWIDRSLAGGQLTAASEHLADCVACQATLAAFARTTSPEAVPEPWWRRSLSARWLVPVAATATVIAIWVAVPRDEYTRQPAPTTTTAVEQSATPQTKSTGEPAARADRSSPAAVDDRLPEQPAPELRREAAAKGAPGVRENEERRDSASLAAGNAAPASPGTAPDSTLAERARLGATAGSVILAPPRIEIVSPDASIRWRIGPSGVVEYSEDAGATWEATPTGVGTDLLGGASPSGTVCWVVGRAGIVLRTTDGRRWQRLMFPLAVDLTAIQATDARTATVTAMDGRRFTTLDGGTTWK